MAEDTSKNISLNMKAKTDSSISKSASDVIAEINKITEAHKRMRAAVGAKITAAAPATADAKKLKSQVKSTTAAVKQQQAAVVNIGKEWTLVKQTVTKTQGDLSGITQEFRNMKGEIKSVNLLKGQEKVTRVKAESPAEVAKKTAKAQADAIKKEATDQKKFVRDNVAAIKKIEDRNAASIAKTLERKKKASADAARKEKSEQDKVVKRGIANIEKIRNRKVAEIGSTLAKRKKAITTEERKFREAIQKATALTARQTSVFKQRWQKAFNSRNIQHAALIRKEMARETRARSVATRGAVGEVRGAIGKVAIWSVATTAIFGTIRAARNAVTTIVELEDAGASMARVFRGTSEETNVLMSSLNRLAVARGRLPTEVTPSAIDFARLGLDRVQILEAQRAALLATNVAEISAAEAVTFLRSAMLQFNTGIDGMLPTLDQWNALSNKNAVTVKQLGEAVAQAGAQFRSVGGEIETLNAFVTALAAATGKSGRQIGTALKTISSFIQRAKTLRKIEAIAGFSPVLEGGQIEDVSVIIAKLAAAWDRLSDAERSELAQSVAGVRQKNFLLSLLRQYPLVIKAYIDQINSMGSAEKEEALIQETLGFHARQFAGELETLFNQIGQSGVSGALKDFLDIGREAIVALGGLSSGTVSLVAKLTVLGIIVNVVVRALQAEAVAAAAAATATGVLNVQVGILRTASMALIRTPVGIFLLGLGVIATIAATKYKFLSDNTRDVTKRHEELQIQLRQTASIMRKVRAASQLLVATEAFFGELKPRLPGEFLGRQQILEAQVKMAELGQALQLSSSEIRAIVDRDFTAVSKVLDKYANIAVAEAIDQTDSLREEIKKLRTELAQLPIKAEGAAATITNIFALDVSAAEGELKKARQQKIDQIKKLQKDIEAVKESEAQRAIVLQKQQNKNEAELLRNAAKERLSILTEERKQKVKILEVGLKAGGVPEGKILEARVKSLSATQQDLRKKREEEIKLIQGFGNVMSESFKKRVEANIAALAIEDKLISKRVANTKKESQLLLASKAISDQLLKSREEIAQKFAIVDIFVPGPVEATQAKIKILNKEIAASKVKLAEMKEGSKAYLIAAANVDKMQEQVQKLAKSMDLQTKARSLQRAMEETLASITQRIGLAEIFSPGPIEAVTEKITIWNKELRAAQKIQSLVDKGSTVWNVMERRIVRANKALGKLDNGLIKIQARMARALAAQKQAFRTEAISGILDIEFDDPVERAKARVAELIEEMKRLNAVIAQGTGATKLESIAAQAKLNQMRESFVLQKASMNLEFAKINAIKQQTKAEQERRNELAKSFLLASREEQIRTRAVQLAISRGVTFEKFIQTSPEFRQKFAQLAPEQFKGFTARAGLPGAIGAAGVTGAKPTEDFATRVATALKEGGQIYKDTVNSFAAVSKELRDSFNKVPNRVAELVGPRAERSVEMSFDFDGVSGPLNRLVTSMTAVVTDTVDTKLNALEQRIRGVAQLRPPAVVIGGGTR